MKKILLILIIGITLLPALFGESIEIQMNKVESGFYRRDIGTVDFRMSNYWKEKLKYNSEINDVTIGTLIYKENIYHILYGTKDNKNILLFDSNMNYNFSDDKNQWLMAEPTYGISEIIGIDNVDYLRLLVGMNDPIDDYVLIEGLNSISLNAYNVTHLKGTYVLDDEHKYEIIVGQKENFLGWGPENLLIGIDQNFNQVFEIDELYESDETIIINEKNYGISEFVTETSTLKLGASVEISKKQSYPIGIGKTVVLEEYFAVPDSGQKIIFVSSVKNQWSQQWFDYLYQIKDEFGINFYFFVPDFECQSCDDRFMKALENVETLKENDFISFIDKYNFDLLHLILLNEKNEVVYTSNAVLNSFYSTWETVYDFITFKELKWLIENIL